MFIVDLLIEEDLINTIRDINKIRTPKGNIK